MAYKPNTGCESSKVRQRIVTYLHGYGIDAGAGGDPILPVKAKSKEVCCLAVDRDGGVNIDLIADVSKLPMFADESLDFVYSSHTLEDFHYWQMVVEEWWRIVRVGGHLIIYCPLTKGIAKNLGLANWEDFYPDMDEADADRNLDHRTDLNPVAIKEYVASLSPVGIEVDEIRNTKEDTEYSFLLVFKKLASVGVPPVAVSKPNGHDKKRAVVVRYGAFGDAIMSTPVISTLHKQGYEVHLNCTPYSLDVYKNNHKIAKILLQERESMPVDKLKDQFAEFGKRYDRVVNLCGSIEDSMLIPDYRAFNYMKELRDKQPDTVTDKEIFLQVIKAFRKQFGTRNYYDAHLEKAGLDERGLNGELYFTDLEHRMAHDFLRQHAGKYLILWSLSGSAIHKVYPYFHHTVQGLLTKFTDVLVVSVGDAVCRIMEPPPSSRYLPRSGDWSIRMSMIMTKYADLVIGPETGILNAAGCFDTPKITLRSHSSHDNLCKYWVNDFCMEPDPERVPCYPCHILHYSDETCLTAPIVDEALGKELVPKAIKNEFHHPLCVSWGVQPNQIVDKVTEIRDKFELKNPRPLNKALLCDSWKTTPASLVGQ